MLEGIPIGRIQTSIETIDRYAIGTLALYCFNYPHCHHGTPFQGDSHQDDFRQEQFGLMDPQPFQYGFDLGGGLKLDFHGSDLTTLTYGHMKSQIGNEIIKEYNGYECSMLDPILKDNFKKFP